MTGLDSQNRRSSIQQDGIINECGSALEGCDAEVFNNTGSRGHGCHIGQGRVKVKAAVEGGRSIVEESLLQSVEMGRLVRLDGREDLGGNDVRREPSSIKISGRELGKGLRVELALKLIENIRKVYNIVWSGANTDRTTVHALKTSASAADAARERMGRADTKTGAAKAKMDIE